MSALPVLPLSPLPEAATAELARLLDGLEPPALWWLSGYAAALAARAAPRPESATAPARETHAPARLTVLYGSQTGNAKRLAERIAADAEAAGLAVRVVRADAYRTGELATEKLLYVVISTQGDNDPPDDARAFLDFLDGRRAPKLPDLAFAVIGLGDSSYPEFCGVGRRVDARLAALGAKRAIGRADADLDIDTVATPWRERALALARDTLKSAGSRVATVTPLRPSTPAATRERPFAAEVLANQRLTARDSDRDVRHVELSLAGSGLVYEPGDALGVRPENPRALVAAVLDALKLDGETPVAGEHGEHPLCDWLATQRELTRLSRPLLVAHAERARSADLDALLDPGHAKDLSDVLRKWQPIDLLRAHPARWSASDLVSTLRPLTPRLYSIASSRLAVGDEAHLTVARVAYDAFGIAHVGAASAHLAALGDGERVSIFVEPNERFRLPADNTRDIVMIGPGTGVAPFRAFVQERAETGASGRNWLVFGNPHRHADFLYQTEWQAALKSGALDRLDVAFSRDQADKIYVQHRLRESGRDLYDAIERGAHVFVCGDATRMARDVHEALVEIIARESGKDRDHAEARLAELQAEGRYARDVY